MSQRSSFYYSTILPLKANKKLGLKRLPLVLSGARDMIDLFEALRFNDEVEVLTIYNFHVSKTCCEKAGEMLRDNTCIKDFRLDAPLCHRKFELLCKHLKHNNTLRSFDVNYPELTLFDMDHLKQNHSIIRVGFNTYIFGCKRNPIPIYAKKWIEENKLRPMACLREWALRKEIPLDLERLIAGFWEFSV